MESFTKAKTYKRGEILTDHKPREESSHFCPTPSDAFIRKMPP